MTTISFIGAGNLATHLALRMAEKGYQVQCVCSRTMESARALANKLSDLGSQVMATTSLNDIPPSDIIIISVTDSALEGIIASMPEHLNEALLLHTAGSMPLNIFKSLPPYREGRGGSFGSFGVLYPMQTFSKSATVDFTHIPTFVEGSDDATTERIKTLALTLTNNVTVLSSADRKYLHIAAVFACNFANHVIDLGSTLLSDHGIDPRCLLPLIDVTCSKLHSLTPRDAQTGPAVRRDINVISNHLDILHNDKHLYNIYKVLSDSIINKASTNSIMTGHDIKVIAMDLDGTLTNEQKEITPDTMEALMKAQQKGIRLVLASGRPPYGMRPLARQLHMEQYGGLILCYNGGHVETCEEVPQVLVEQELDEALLPQLKQFQEQSGMTLMTYYEDTIYTEHPDDKYVAISAFNNKMKVVGVKDFVRNIPRPINKCLMVGDPDKVPYWEERMQQVMEGRMHILRSTPYFIELLPIGIDKGPSLVSMLGKLGLTPQQMMAFGDSYNDITMLQVAGIGVAMANAEDKVKAAANHVTDDNDHDGIAKALRHFGII